MPSASPKSSMSLGELATCEDFLDGPREYAIDLLANLEKIRQWHGMDSCSESREGRPCVVCELCSADGLLGATKKALASYNDTEKQLQEVRSLLRKRVLAREAPGRETLFKSDLAKAVILRIVTVGDTLRLQHATWQARLQSELVTLTPSAEPVSTGGPGDLDKNRNMDILLPTYSGPRFIGPEPNPKLTAVSTGSVSETMSSSSMFIVFRRCLSSDCPCEANRTSASSNTNPRGRGACGSHAASKVPPSSSDSKKTRSAKVIAATRGGGDRAARSTHMNPARRSKGTSDTSDILGKAGTNARTQKPSACRELNSSDTRVLDARKPQDVMLGECYEPSSPRLETALLTQGAESSSSPSPELIMDPRVFRLRAQVARSDDARRALMEWYRAWTAQLDPRESHEAIPEISTTHESIMKGTRGYLSALVSGPESGESARKLLCKAGQVGEAATNGLSHGDDETTAQELRFNSEQEELKRRWLMTRQKRFPSILAVKMRTATEALLHTLNEVENHLRTTHTWLAEMSKQDLEVQAFVKAWTVPRDRYEKRVGKANAFFGPMEWDEIMLFAQTEGQECVPDSWNFLCMLEHLSDKLPAKMETFKDVYRHMLIAVAEVRKLLEMGIPDNEAESYQEEFQENTLSLTNMITEVQTGITQQRDKAVEVLQRLEKSRRPVCCAEARKASALSYFMPSGETDRVVQCGPQCWI
ncbi:hypothetical protein J3R83DRAFT_9420 [Lanmaoa asiatica]|nr:hypothetical protein J3R83DRAFT_9420 [Lanmaoa asiatica]